MKKLFYLSHFLIVFSMLAFSANGQDISKIKVFLDCSNCNENYYRTQLGEVSFVRDRKVADVHILLSSTYLGTGTQHWELQFIEIPEKEGKPTQLTTDTFQAQTENEVDQHILKYIKAGLLPYLLENSSEMEVDFSLPKASEQNMQIVPDSDPWNFWVFEIGGDIDFSKESNQSEYELEGELDLERTTEAWRYRGEIEYLYQNNKINRNGTEFNSSLKRVEASGSVVKTLGEHWAAGVFGRMYSSTFTNIKQGSSLQAAMEFNFFPYKQVATKEFTIAYFIGPRMFEYFEPSIYEETQENRMAHNLSINLNLRKPWGTAEVRLKGYQFLHDLSKNRVELSSELSVRLVKGLFLRTSADFSVIRDQLYLPKGDASIEEILLERRAIATDYETSFSVGIAYVFGSIYNSIVNTRL